MGRETGETLRPSPPPESGVRCGPRPRLPRPRTSPRRGALQANPLNLSHFRVECRLKRRGASGRVRARTGAIAHVAWFAAPQAQPSGAPPPHPTPEASHEDPRLPEAGAPSGRPPRRERRRHLDPGRQHQVRDQLVRHLRPRRGAPHQGRRRGGGGRRVDRPGPRHAGAPHRARHGRRPRDPREGRRRRRLGRARHREDPRGDREGGEPGPGLHGPDGRRRQLRRGRPDGRGADGHPVRHGRGQVRGRRRQGHASSASSRAARSRSSSCRSRASSRCRRASTRSATRR